MQNLKKISIAFVVVFCIAITTYSALSFVSGGLNRAELNTSITVDTTSPNILLVTLNNTNFTSNPVSFFYNASDNTSAIANCSLDINITPTRNQTDLIIEELINNTFNVTFQQGHYRWNVSCADSIGNTNSSVTNFLIFDSLAPVISFLTPTSGQEVIFRDYAGFINVSLNEIGGNCTQNNETWRYNSGNLTFFSFLNATQLNLTTYNINMSCSDFYGNNGSTTLTFSVVTNPTPGGCGGGGGGGGGGDIVAEQTYEPKKKEIVGKIPTTIYNMLGKLKQFVINLSLIVREKTLAFLRTPQTMTERVFFYSALSVFLIGIFMLVRYIFKPKNVMGV